MYSEHRLLDHTPGHLPPPGRWCGAVVFVTELVLAASLWAGSYSGGGGPNAWYQDPYTPREVGMGMTGVASAQGPGAALWNPALICSPPLSYRAGRYVVSGVLPLNSHNLSGGRGGGSGLSTMRDATSYTGSVSTTFPLPRVTGGRSVLHIRYSRDDEIPETYLTGADEIAVTDIFAVTQMLVVLGAAYPAFSMSQALLSVGGTIKYQYSSFGSGRHRVAGFDAGVYVDADSLLGLGAVYRCDREPRASGPDITQSTFSSGVVLRNPFRVSWIEQLAIDLELGNYSPSRLSVGCETRLPGSLHGELGLSWSEPAESEQERTSYAPDAYHAGLVVPLRWLSVEVGCEIPGGDSYRSYVLPNVLVGLNWRSGYE